MKQTLLITGWLWYIGSHAVVAFEQAGYQTLIIDNLINSSEESIIWIEKILGYSPLYFEGDICDTLFLENIFSKYSIDGVVHFAWLKAVWESTEKIWLYHRNNVSGSIALFEVMERFAVRKCIFSSSATVYDPINAPEYIEWQSLGTTNPYGTTKLVIEKLLEDYAQHAHWSIISLRYFNPIWAHPSGYIWEIPNGIPNNLLPFVFDVASWKRAYLRIFWDDYETHDGTGVRDYIDVCDLIEAHKKAFERLETGFIALNIGTGKWKSVTEMKDLVEKVTGTYIAYQVYPRREGDIAEFYANSQKAKEYLEWKSETSLEESIKNGWNFIQKKNV